MLILTILIVGLSGMVAQVMLLRELLLSFYGNELTVGIILANWVISEALGVFLVGKFIGRIKNKINIFIILQILFSLTLPLAIYSSRTFKSMAGIPFAEAIGLSAILYASFFIIFPVSFCHGALFNIGIKLYALSKDSALDKDDSANAIGRVYAWEAIGTIIGGVILTYLFISYLNSFQIVFIIALVNLMTCLFFFKNPLTAALKYLTVFLIALILYLFVSGNVNNIQRLAIVKQWDKVEPLDYRNSVYGNVAVVKKEKQYTFFYNGIPIITSPYPDITFVEEFGNLPLLFHPAPRKILILSGGAGGIINEILKHPLEKIDYAELDPLIIEMLKKYPTFLTERELRDSRVHVINLDGRFFVRTTLNQYDVILIGLSRPADLTSNRLFTQKFFSLSKRRLKQQGILALWLPGSLTYISQELGDLNACIANALKDTYGYVRVIPGDYNIFLASDDKNIMEVNSELVMQRINQRNIKTNILLPNYLDYRLDKERLTWFMHSLASATKKINQDTRPFAVFQMLILWNKQFSGSLASILQALGNLNLIVITVIIVALTFMLFYIFSLRSQAKGLAITYSIATTGFFGMLINLILVFSFQVIYGLLYYRIGIFMSVFMAGIALGSILMTRYLGNVRNLKRLFIAIEVVIAVFSYILAAFIDKLDTYINYANLIFTLLFVISGFFLGLEFPLASKIRLQQKDNLGTTVGILYAADLIGSWMAGIFGGVVLLPVLGILQTCMVIVMLKLSSLFLLLSTKKEFA